jgi:hypothetical protein
MKIREIVMIAALGLLSTFIGCAGVKGSTSTSTNTNTNPGPVTTPSQPATGTGNTPYSGVKVATWHGDNGRTGLNATETSLTASNVHVSTFGKLFSYQVDGHVYAQPLYVSNVPVDGNLHNVLYVATEFDSVYAFDADDPGSGTPLWKASLLNAGEKPLTGANPQPWIGITSTPVIDVQSKTLYTVGAIGGAKFRLAAVDIENGNIRSSVQITASVPSTAPDAVNGQLILTTSCLQRSALLLSQGTLFISFGGCPHGWVLSYDAASLHQIAVLNISPNQDGYGKFPGGGGVWGSGAGPAADDSGNVYVVTGDGPNDQQTAWGESVLKLNKNLQVLDYFTPAEWEFLTCKDNDLGSAGAMLMPGLNQLVVGGKNSKMFVLNQGALGHLQTNNAGAAFSGWYNNSSYTDTCTDPKSRVLTGPSADYRIYGTAAWFNGSIFVGAAPGPVKKFKVGSGGALSLSSQGPSAFPLSSLGTTPAISANGSTNGIVWAVDHGSPLASAAVLHAYDALDLSHELYNSAQNGADTAGLGIKFTAPIVANGKVYVGTANDPNGAGEIDVYGLLPHTR